MDWRAANAPPGVQPLRYLVAPSNARVTYGCALTSARSASVSGARVVVTRDGGQTWSRGMDLPYSGQLSDCEVVVDANDPLRAITWLNTAKIGAPPDPGNVRAFLSQDGGLTWRALPNAGPHLALSLTSSAGAIYAGGNGLDASGNWVQDLWVSRDGGVSWRALHATHLTPNVRVWANPRTGELLGFNDFDSTLWRSDTGGVGWTRISPPPAPPGAGQSFVVAPHLAGWFICAITSHPTSQNSPDRGACSDDLGATWGGAPLGSHSELSPKGFMFTAFGDVLSITVNGSLLAAYDDIKDGSSLDWLAPGASAWAPVKTPTNAAALGVGYVYCSGPAGGALWVPTDDPAHPFSTALYP